MFDGFGSKTTLIFDSTRIRSAMRINVRWVRFDEDDDDSRFDEDQGWMFDGFGSTIIPACEG